MNCTLELIYLGAFQHIDGVWAFRVVQMFYTFSSLILLNFSLQLERFDCKPPNLNSFSAPASFTRNCCRSYLQLFFSTGQTNQYFIFIFAEIWLQVGCRSDHVGREEKFEAREKGSIVRGQPHMLARPDSSSDIISISSASLGVKPRGFPSRSRRLLRKVIASLWLGNLLCKASERKMQLTNR